MNGLAVELKKLGTEKQNAASANLDTMSALEIATVMNREDAKVAAGIKKVLPQIARAIDVIADRLSKGGRLIYVGAGTSGRIGALDSSECPPTFNTDPKMVQYVIAGGPGALGSAAESNEDSPELGRKDIAAKKPGKKDVVIGIAASGRTPYTIAAVEYASKKGAATVAVVCNSGSALAKAAQVAIEVVVGPEVLTGSTRLKAGTAQKLVCNMLTTGAMSRMGYVYGNLMVNVHLKNEKLVERGITILQKATGVDRDSALTALEAAGMKVPVALVMLNAGVSKAEALKRLKKANGRVRKAIGAK
ncbi:MAG TPA: N-acetylmuramic acid 6-phosphate etherase [Terriglobales bacterium]|nr:N-acetylmuramic acid 6-phosphate etherase [Terriglobales bacterium]